MIKIVAKKNNRFNAYKPKIPLVKNIKRTYIINFSKLLVRKQITSRIGFGIGHSHEMLIIQN